MGDWTITENIGASAVKMSLSAKIKGGASCGIFLAGACWLLVGCQSVAYISTDPPGSTIYVNNRQIGLTPIELNEGAGSKVAGGYLAEVRHPGYSRVWVWIPVGLLGVDVNLNLKPFTAIKVEDRKQAKYSASRIVINKLTAKMLRLQQSMLDDSGDTSGATKDLDELLDAYPEVGSLYFLRAIDELKSNKSNEAKKSLARAMSYSPKEYDFLTLYNLVGGEAAAAGSSNVEKGGANEPK